MGLDGELGSIGIPTHMAAMGRASWQVPHVRDAPKATAGRQSVARRDGSLPAIHRFSVEAALQS